MKTIKVKNTNMVSIQTKYMPPTNTRGSRIKAFTWSQSITIPFPHELNIDDAHAFAAKELIKKLKWNEERSLTIYQAGSADERGSVFVVIYEGEK